MQLLNHDVTHVTIRFSKDEIGFLNDVVNEVLNGLDSDFSIRTGWTKEEARALLESLHAVQFP